MNDISIKWNKKGMEAIVILAKKFLVIKVVPFLEFCVTNEKGIAV